MIASAIAFSSLARLWKVIARSTGPPTLRACASIAAAAGAPLPTCATVSLVTAERMSVRFPAGSIQRSEAKLLHLRAAIGASCPRVFIAPSPGGRVKLRQQFGEGSRTRPVPLPEKFFAALEFFDPPSRGGFDIASAAGEIGVDRKSTP